jgi:hypothetical protein
MLKIAQLEPRHHAFAEKGFELQVEAWRLYSDAVGELDLLPGVQKSQAAAFSETA